MNLKGSAKDFVKNSYNLRIFLLMLLLAIFMGLIALRLFSLQIINHARYQVLAENQHRLNTTITPTRGQIYLTPQAANTQPLLVATNLSQNMVYAIPKEVVDKSGAAEKLAPILSIPVADLIAKLASPTYVPIKKELSEAEAAHIKALKIAGIYLEAQNVRFYPEKTLASQVIGFLGFKGSDRVGQYGVEGAFQEQLAGASGSLNTNTSASGSWIDTGSQNLVSAKDGDDIYLTVDPAIEFKAEEVLKAAVAAHNANSGSIVVMNPKTGAILAMANEPDFDPNNYNQAKDLSVFNNLAATAEYEPGSVFKAITMAAALNEGKVTPETTYDNTGSVQVGDKLIKNSDPNALHGMQNMIAVLDQSLNTGAYFAEQQIGNDTFKKYVQAFGFGKSIGSFELSQVAGNLANLNQKGDVFFATASFGQGITMTPLQLVQAYGAIANGGKMAQPYIVSKIVHPDGSEDTSQLASGPQVIDSKAASTLSAMLVDVVENGHGKKAGVKGYYIAGKTGTAQVAYSSKAGYDPNTNIGTFIGFGPVDNPQFVMLVRIDDPKDVKFAETTAAPTFGELAQFILNYLQVPPSRQ